MDNDKSRKEAELLDILQQLVDVSRVEYKQMSADARKAFAKSAWAAVMKGLDEVYTDEEISMILAAVLEGTEGNND